MSNDFEVVPVGTQARLAAVEADLRSMRSCFAVTELERNKYKAERDALQTKADRAEQCAAYEAQRADKAEAERDALLTELETERMRLAACGVVAMANTPESAAQARVMSPPYWSASCAAVAAAVDREIALRAERDALREALRKHVVLHDGDCICEDCAAIAKVEGSNG